MRGNASAAQNPAEPAPKVASGLFISHMGPPAQKTASMAKIWKSRAWTKTRKASVAHLQQLSSSLGDSRAGAQSAVRGPSGAISDAAAARAGKQQAASPPARQVS